MKLKPEPKRKFTGSVFGRGADFERPNFGGGGRGGFSFEGVAREREDIIQGLDVLRPDKIVTSISTKL